MKKEQTGQRLYAPDLSIQGHKKEKCELPAFSTFPVMFSKTVFRRAECSLLLGHDTSCFYGTCNKCQSGSHNFFQLDNSSCTTMVCT